MPTPTPVKNRGQVVRQLSLQSHLPLHSTKYSKLKKQFSEDDGKALSVVEITGQGWPSIERSDSVFRLDLSDGKNKQSKISGGRPKPAKMAWIDKKQETFDCPLDVEIVATKCRSQLRPLSIKTQRYQTPLLGNKDALAYTRSQLAERLRNAWSEREKIKPNLNIFLAHTSDATRHDNLSSDRQDTISTLSDTLDRKIRPLQIRAFSQESCLTDVVLDKPKTPTFERENKQMEDEIANEKPPEELVEEDKIKDDLQDHRELKKIEVKVIKSEKDSFENKEDVDSSQKEDPEEKIQIVKSSQSSTMTAKDRRKCFRSSSALHKTINESFSLPNKEEGMEEGMTESGKKQIQKKVLVRASSAPTQDQALSKEVPIQKTKFLIRKRLQPTTNIEAADMSPKDVNVSWDRIKSAPIRRKLKSAAARRKNKDKGDSSSEDEMKESSTSSKKTVKRGSLKNGSDIVTMVSLVSPAESDTEDSVISVPVESIHTDSGETEAATQSKTPGQESIKGAMIEIQKFISLRKTPKTVTFQTNPVFNRSYSASFPSRRAPAGTPIIIPSPVINNPALTPAQLQERDKRPPTIFTRSDGKGIKRRLIRSSSEPVKGDDGGEDEDDKSKILGSSSVHATDFEEFSSDVAQKDNKIEEPEGNHPQFKCPKEKECWDLYKKMIATGISVTFDTVLRGMLTPTEYRLKKNRLLSNC